MEIKTLADINPTAVMETFNEGFSDYLIPIRYNAEQWAYKMQSENVQWDLAVGAFDDQRLVGFILHGTKQRDGQQWIYNGGTAVIPSHRGRQLTQKMYDYILPILRARKAEKVILEVIDNNTPAIKSYQHVGFKPTRRFECFKGALRKNDRRLDGITVRELTNLDWQLLRRFWDIVPSWQNDIEAVELARTSVKVVGAFQGNELVGYLVYNPLSHRIVQLAVAHSFRQQGIATALLTNAFFDTTAEVAIINVEDTAAGTISCLTKLGLQKLVVLHEMELAL